MALEVFAGFTLVDLAVAVLFVVFAVWKGHKGLYESFMPLVVTLAAMVGALIVTRLLQGPVTEWVWPTVRDRLSEQLNLEAFEGIGLDRIAAVLEGQLSERLVNLGEKLGLDLQTMVAGALRSAAASVGEAAANAAIALLRIVTERVVGVVLFLLSWGVLKLLLTLLKNALGLVWHLPVFHGLDGLLGAVLGLAECFVILYVVIWIAYLLNIGFIIDLVRSSRILTWIDHI